MSPVAPSTALLAMALALVVTTGAAQTPGGTTPAQPQRAPTRANPQPQRAPFPEVRVPPDVGPRLDPGAVLCRTADDLRQHHSAVAARLNGDPAIAEPVGCSRIRTRTAVVVLQRDGPAQTQVRLFAAPNQTGWTDAFLPDR